ncbi:MAG: hypothetical protein MUC63_10065, partial [Planctomycetes bacterium]|nr:hypothetical protein [Planctomycetota bacterium]
FSKYERNVPVSLRFGLYRGGRIAERSRALYFRHLHSRLVAPAAARLEAEMKALRDKPKKNLADYERLHNLYQAYLMMAGRIDPQPPVLREVLGDGGRWTAGIEDPQGGRPERLLPMAKRQLDFWALEVVSSKAARIAPKEEVVDSVRKELSEALWMTETYRDLVGVARDDFPPIDRSFLYQGPHADLFSLETLFSTIYTQTGWNEYIRNAIVDRSESLARKFADLGIEKEPDAIAARLRQDFVTDYLRRWNGLLETTRLRPASSLTDASDMVRILSGPETPYPGFLDSVRKNQVLRLSPTEAANEPAGDLKWLPDAIKALAELHVALDAFVRATKPGSRVVTGQRTQKLAPLVQALQDARQKLLKACLSVPPADRAAVQSFMGQPIDRAREALAREAQDEVESLWSSLVHETFEREFKGRYPFDPAASEEVSTAAFSRMLNRKNGIYWDVAKVVEALHTTYIDSLPLVATSGDYDRSVRDAETVRDAFYPPDERAFSVKFFVTLKQFAGVRDVRFRLSDKAFSLYDRPDRRGAFTWSEEGAGGARVAICVGVNQWVEKEAPGPWGLLRLIRSGDPRPVGASGMFECRWNLEANILGRIETFQVAVLFEPAEQNDLFKETFFERFAVPAKIGP